MIPASSPAQTTKNAWKWINEKIVERIQVTGYRRLGYHILQIEGDREAFKSGNYGGLGGQRFTDLGYIRIDGRKVANYLNFNFNIQDSRFVDPQGSKFSIDVIEPRWEINLGDIRGRLTNTNRFTRFDRSLSGGSVGYRSSGFEARILRSEPRGEAKTISLSGNNTAGPYYIQSSQIIRGSERIEVDGILQTFGQDYTIDYDLGAVTFINRQTQAAKIIAPTSTIVATYESFGFQNSSGRIEGAGVSYDMKQYGRIGVTGLRQITGTGGRLSTRTERFQGFGPSSTPYFLQFVPLTATAIVVRLDGIVQVEGFDYTFDPQNRSIFYFLRFVPSTSTIEVIYTPTPTDNINGDRESIGIDYRLPLGKGGRNGNITFAQATGRLVNTPAGSSGTARGVDLRYATGNFDLSAGVRDIPRGYVSVESAGFNRNEKTHDWRLAYRPGQRWLVDASHSNASIISRRTTGNQTSFITTRFTRAQAGVSFTPLQGGGSWNANHIRTRARNTVGESTSDTTSLETSRTLGRLTARLALEHQDATAPVTSTSGTKSQRISLQSLNARATYRAHEDWNLNANVGLSQIRSQGKSGLGRDLLAGVSYRPDDNFFIRFQFADSDAGALNSLGAFSSGYGFGYDGNGFSSGSTSGAILGATNSRSFSLASNWAPNTRLSLNGTAALYRTSGSVSSNTETKLLSVGANYELGRNNRVAVAVDTSDTTYLGSPLRSSATTIGLFLDGNPPGRFSYNIGLSSLIAGGNSDFRQNAFTYDITLNYLVAPRHNLAFVTRNGKTTGYYPQDDAEIAFIYQYRIWQNLSLNVGYRWREVINRDPLLSSGAYRSRGFDIELAFNFGQ